MIYYPIVKMLKVVILLTFIAAVYGAPSERTVIPKIPDGRIVGGENTDIRNYPYQVSLQYLNSHFCGGVIISSTWVLTAAHCVSGIILTSFLSVRAGSTYHGSGGSVYSLSRIIVHPNYSRTTLDYDIASLQTSSAITVANSEPIPLPRSTAAPSAGVETVITGWGTLSSGGISPSILQVVRVPVVSQADCRRAYSTSSITDRMFCIGLLGIGGKDACQGDSGGPTAIGGVLYGLVSWGEGCAHPEFPGVKASIPNMLEWVLANSGA